MLSTPTPARPTTFSRAPAAIASRVDLHPAAHDQRVVFGQGGEEFVARRGRACTSTSCSALEQVEPLAREGLGDEDPHAPDTAAAGVRPGLAAAVAAASTAPADVDVVPELGERLADDLDRGDHVLEADTSPRWPMRRI